MTELSLPQPDDFHLHLRDGAVLADTATAAAAQFHYATIMPNLQPPVTTAAMAVEYRQRILDAIHLPSSHTFTPLMTLYLTDHTTPSMINQAKASGAVHACKLYPAGATTHSASGVSLHDSAALQRLRPTFEAMADCGLLLLIHGEVTDPAVDIFHREAAFLSTFLPFLRSSHPTLRIVLEHVTTADAVDAVLASPSNLAATITPHHLLVNRNALFAGGLNPHHYCLPILKAERHRLALLKAATSGDPRFFAGTDSAPHSKARKVTEGCAGCYVAYAAVELYAEAFEQAGRLDRLEDFVSHFGRRWYGVGQAGLERRKVRLTRAEWTVPSSLPFGSEEVVPFHAGKRLQWKLTPAT